MSVNDKKSVEIPDIGDYDQTTGDFLLNACVVRAYFDRIGAENAEAHVREYWGEKSRKMDIVINLIDEIIFDKPSKYEFKEKEVANDDDEVVVAPRRKRSAIAIPDHENDNEVIEARNHGDNDDADDERPTRPPSPVDNENRESSSSSSSSSSSNAASLRSLRLPSPPIGIIDDNDDDDNNEEEEEEEEEEDEDDIVFPPAPRFHRVVTRTIHRSDGSTATFTFTE